MHDPFLRLTEPSRGNECIVTTWGTLYTPQLHQNAWPPSKILFSQNDFKNHSAEFENVSYRKAELIVKFAGR
jgi:hypothetical protein